MAQQGVGCNGSVVPEGVFKDTQVTGLIDQRHVKPHIRQRAFGFAANEFFGGSIDTAHLFPVQALQGAVMASAFLHFDKDDPVAVAHDQINFARLTAPPFMCQIKAAAAVVIRDLQFSRTTCVIGNSALNGFRQCRQCVGHLRFLSPVPMPPDTPVGAAHHMPAPPYRRHRASNSFPMRSQGQRLDHFR